MKGNQYHWNETLKFSWGHIIALLAIIALSYVMYMGCFYGNGGDFVKSAIMVAVIDAVVLALFMGAQIVKASESHFKRSIRIERVLIILCPVALIIAMIPVNHFWNVVSQKHEIESQFNTSVKSAQQIFTDYNLYTADRIANYTEVLDSLKQAGKIDKITRDNYLLTLKLQIESTNTDSISNLATEWIKSANNGASVWNAFLIGNIEQITSAIESWNKTLTDYSSYILSNENLFGNEAEAFPNKSYIESVNGLNKLTSIYAEKKGLNLNSLWSGALLFFMLLLPYLLQDRNTRAQGWYTLVPKFGDSTSSKPRRKKSKKADLPDVNTDDTDWPISDPTTTSTGTSTNQSDNDDLYSGSF